MRYTFLTLWILIGIIIFLPGCRLMFRADRMEYVAVFSETVDDANANSEAFYDQSSESAERNDAEEIPGP